MKDLISVIIPVYNVAQYLEQCIESVLSQTYNNLEVILIDDGSTDGGGEICDEYSKKDNRVIVIHKSNGGLSAARNTGVQQAKGEYISFVDSDDWLELDFIEILYNGIKKYGTEIAACGRFIVTESCKNKLFCSDEAIILSRKEALSHIFRQNLLDVAAWDKLYHKSVIENIVFPEGEINEDTAVIYDVFSNVNKVVHVGVPLYNYRVRGGSITKSVYSEKFDVVLEHIDKLSSCITETDSDLVDELDIYIAHLSYNMLVKIIRTDYTKYRIQYKSYFNKFKKTWITYLTSGKVTFDNKLRCILIRMHLFNLISGLVRKVKCKK